MKIKRFFAKDMRAALSQVKEELGADAVIMSNKKVTGGVEIVAAVDTDVPNEPSPEAIQSRNALAERLGQAKRKLAEDKVQLQQPSSRFANVLNSYAGGESAGDSGDEMQSEVDSLSALLHRQSKQQAGSRDAYSGQNSQQSGSSSFRQGYGDDAQARRMNGFPANDRRKSEPGQMARGLNRANNRRDTNHHEGHRQDSHQGYQPRHALDIGEYRRPDARGYEPLSGQRQKNSYSSAPKKGNRLDPTRYDPKASQYEQDEMESMRSELATIRRLLEHQVSGLMWQEVERREPMRAMMIKRLEKMGLSPELSDQLACYIPEDVPANEAWPALLELLSDQIITTDDCILETGGVVALLGPTGVGKTTTIAKLAARAAMEFGPDQIALVTTDTFRIGAHEQLATYGRIMGCPVRVAKDAEELADILHQLRHRRLVLLDTAGMGQRDIRLSEQLDTLMHNSGSQIRSFLVLPATAQRRVLHETIEHFRRIPLSGCVLTKLDESLSLGEVICMAIQHALPIAYLADGQRVPEDIKVATGNYLVARANELLEQELSQQSHFWTSDSSENLAADFYD
ncbi:flagellar biosynthesis protein FlhF [Photobacterium ganghwense]|uniref:flagellar biosynthesis protein FlhF n=1 Tax=Photobacterium ganghwense TaxID=320778 RepID=UPI001A8CD436|nr:flagellar biosynthesis protein FlhF [Photobacterium ganghwense]MBV1840672.1 flagellar biosynthesis protein FlhF [Photobacterium ganghwense]QSV13371.1 flagellar biosynthesis protein FlhF [Photobacterium ganghwense]